MRKTIGYIIPRYLHVQTCTDPEMLSVTYRVESNHMINYIHVQGSTITPLP